MISNTLKMLSVALGTALLAGPAAAGTVTFDDMVHGEVLQPNRYSGAGVWIHTRNMDEKFDIGAAFDTTATGTRDSDLEDPWTTGNLAGPTDMGRALIIQENQTGCDTGICSEPDDEGSRPAGYFAMRFKNPIAAFSLDLLDVDNATSEQGGLMFFSGGSNVGTVRWSELDGTFVAGAGTIGYGDNSANRLPDFLATNFGVDYFDQVIAVMGGSGAIDNLRWEDATIRPVPEPSAALVFALGLGILGIRRRA